MSIPKLFIVTGISGAGKTTVARHLLERGEVAFDSKVTPGIYQFIDADGNVASSVKLHDKDWRNIYKWSLNQEELSKLLKQNRDTSRVFLCGRANLFQYWHLAEKVFLLRVDKTTLLQRLNNESRDNLFAKDQETQHQLLKNLDAVQNKIAGKGAEIIDATTSIDNVINQILQKAST